MRKADTKVVHPINRIRVTVWLPIGLDAADVLWDETDPANTDVEHCGPSDEMAETSAREVRQYDHQR